MSVHIFTIYIGNNEQLAQTKLTRGAGRYAEEFEEANTEESSDAHQAKDVLQEVVREKPMVDQYLSNVYRHGTQSMRTFVNGYCKTQ